MLMLQSSVFIYTSAVTVEICGKARRLPVLCWHKTNREPIEIKQQVSKMISALLRLCEEEG